MDHWKLVHMTNALSDKIDLLWMGNPESFTLIDKILMQ
jgi:hypothetical protein